MVFEAIKWSDSAGFGEYWVHQEDWEKQKPAVIHTAGKVIHETDNTITVASSIPIDPKTCHGAVIQIPKHAIIDRYRLTRAHEVPKRGR